jgi:hypothetical protein
LSLKVSVSFEKALAAALKVSSSYEKALKSALKALTAASYLKNNNKKTNCLPPPFC